ncbi:MAG: VOC family protein [Burkholderiaceae bacterium]
MNLNQATVAVSDIPRSIDFYLTLGLKLIVRSDHYARFECANGATFSIHQTQSVTPSQTVLYFEREDLDAYVTRLSNAGVVFESGPQHMAWLWREARLRDPDGNPICLYFAGENRLNPPWRIQS